MTANAAELARIRKILPLGIPVSMMLFALAWFFTFALIPELVHELQMTAPVVRIWPGITLGPTLLPLALMMIVIPPMKAIPIGKAFTDRAATWINVLLVINFLAMLLMLTTSAFLQGYFMPKKGYTRCTELKDNSYIWFSDWVRDPAWCVKGKSLEWVNEQARNAESHPPSQ